MYSFPYFDSSPDRLYADIQRSTVRVNEVLADVERPSAPVTLDFTRSISQREAVIHSLVVRP